jgi:hypothetical protein
MIDRCNQVWTKSFVWLSSNVSDRSRIVVRDRLLVWQLFIDKYFVYYFFSLDMSVFLSLARSLSSSKIVFVDNGQMQTKTNTVRNWYDETTPMMIVHIWQNECTFKQDEIRKHTQWLSWLLLMKNWLLVTNEIWHIITTTCVLFTSRHREQTWWRILSSRYVLRAWHAIENTESINIYKHCLSCILKRIK